VWQKIVCMWLVWEGNFSIGRNSSLPTLASCHATYYCSNQYFRNCLFFLLFLLKYHSFFLNIPNLCHVTTSVLSVTYDTLTHPILLGTVGMWLCENTRWEWRYRSANPWFFDEPFNSRHLCASCVVYVKHEQLFYHIIIFKIILQFESIVYSQQAYI